MNTMYTGTMIEDLIQCVELAEQRAHATVHSSAHVAQAHSEPPAYEMNWQDWQELVEVA